MRKQLRWPRVHVCRPLIDAQRRWGRTPPPPPPPSSSSSSSSPSSASSTTCAVKSPTAPQLSSSRVPNYLRRATANDRAMEDDINALRLELVEARLELAKRQDDADGINTRALLRQLSDADVSGHQLVTKCRNEAFVLHMSHDVVEAELRRVLSIGLTNAEVDEAAIASGARHLIRANLAIRGSPAVGALQRIDDGAKTVGEASSTRLGGGDGVASSISPEMMRRCAAWQRVAKVLRRVRAKERRRRRQGRHP